MKPNRLALVLALCCLVTLPVFAAQQGGFDRTLKVTGQVDLDVSTGSGTIKIVRGGDGQVVIHATIQASDHGWFSGDQTEKIRAIEKDPPIEQSGNVIRIGHFYDSDRQRNISISYEIQTPADVRVHSRTGSGNIRIERVNGPVEANTGSGGIDVNDIPSDVRLQTGSGSIVINNAGGAVRAHTGSGAITGNSVGGKAGAASSRAGSVAASGRSYLDFETGSGSIRLQNVAGVLKASTGSGSIDAEGQQAGDWDIDSGSGGIRVRLPGDSKFTLMARTSSGTVSTDFPLTIQGTVNRKELSGAVNGGGPRLDLHTGSGSIHISK